MKKEDYLKEHARLTAEMHEITKRKNADYTGASEDPFHNFKVVESMGICSAEVGFLTRMTDKMSRIAGFVKQGTLQVKDESVADTLLDLANYSLLLLCYLKSKKEESEPKQDSPEHIICSKCKKDCFGKWWRKPDTNEYFCSVKCYDC